MVKSQLLRINKIFASSSSSFVSIFFTIILLWVGSGFVLENTMTPGELMSCYALIGHFTGPVGSLIGINSTIQDALIAADRLFEIMDLEREELEGSISIIAEKIDDIHFEDVTFRYGTRVNIFDQLNLKISNGNITGIVGESGSGKTTLISIIQKIHPFLTVPSVLEASTSRK